jgi:transposase-like protein
MKQKKTPPLPPEIFKGMKTGKDLNEFLSSIYKLGIETLLNAEMDEHLGYEKMGRYGKKPGTYSQSIFNYL